MAVKKAYRRRGVATRLVDEVIQFCTDQCYEGIELITTECHYEVIIVSSLRINLFINIALFFVGNS